MNLFKSKKKQSLKELRDLTAVCSILDEFERRGVLFWRRRDNLLLIEEVLAVLKLAEGRAGFHKFLNQVAMWQSNKLINEA